jgi:hypothetical protein
LPAVVTVKFPRYNKGQIESLCSNEKMGEIMTSQNLLFILGAGKA